MMFTTDIAGKMKLLAVLLAGGAAAAMLLSQTAQAKEASSVKTSASSALKTSPYRPVSVPNRARDYYTSVWGVDNLRVRQTASGNLIRFSYRVADPARAKMLGDKRATPYLFSPQSHALLQIPVMEKIGQLRQTGSPEAGKEYWMVFSNKGNFVKAGDRVNVIIGSIHVDGLLVE